MWDFFETVRHRHSIRQYQQNVPVEKEKLHAILEVACAAPSAGDLQAYKIIVVSDQAMRDALSEACDNQLFISQAPICLVFCADTKRSEQAFQERGRDLFAIQDATIATAYSQLAIVAVGIGSTWVGSFDEAIISQLLELDTGVVPVALLSLGYPAELPEVTSRRNLDEMVSYR